MTTEKAIKVIETMMMTTAFSETEKEALDKITHYLQEGAKPYQLDAVWMCGCCDKEVVGWEDDITGESIRYPYCRQCGKAVKWR